MSASGPVTWAPTTPVEFGRHLAVCDYVLPGVREAARSALAKGLPVCIEPPPVGDRPGQGELEGMPPSGMLVRPKRGG